MQDNKEDRRNHCSSLLPSSGQVERFEEKEEQRNKEQNEHAKQKKKKIKGKFRMVGISCTQAHFKWS